MAWRRCDDLDGTIDDVEPVDLGYDGQVYVLHLGTQNRERLADIMKEWIGNRQPRRPMGTVSDQAPEAQPKPKARPKSKTRTAAEKTASIRAWAAANGFELKGLGRVPGEVVRAYNLANPTPADQ